ncbi:MAG: STN domain-containing protein [Afipia sp.]|uniref:Secretin/TonB short N-terminal domain-containing protein n=1 Tax=Afipia massiliensis TaxID=211460 RepID=A0A840MYL7_9BRAD|nr:STN domain-containing protein [Afipia massiliensis]MBB5051840.1 hypothetical protein [Afipia massiliensis]MCR6736097.1 STN domain-containing protein [Afipia sp.]
MNAEVMAAKSPTKSHLTALVMITLLLIPALVFSAGAIELNSRLPLQPLAFDIPAQPLAAALHAYSRKVGVQVLYDSRSASGQQSVAIQGYFAPDEALIRLLGNTDLDVRRARTDAITLVAPAVIEHGLPPVNPLTDADLVLGELRVRANVRPNDLEKFADYSETVRSEVQRALLKNPQSATGNYRAVLDLWIDPTRTIRKAALLQSTGDAVRDSAITGTLQGLLIRQPTPADAPQPIRAVVAVSTAK